MDSKLPKDGADDVGIEDVGLWTFFREAFDRLENALADTLSVRERRVIPSLEK